MKRKNEQIEENDDFLSDDILKQAEEFDKTRKKTEPKKKQPKYAIPVKSPKVLEQEQREKALQTELNEKNKGFQLLAKMGFSKGMALGNANVRQVDNFATDQPIAINIKQGKSGLGVEEEKQRELDIRLNEMKQLQTQSVSEFKEHHSKKFSEKHLKVVANKALEAAQTLDFQSLSPDHISEFYLTQNEIQKLRDMEGEEHIPKIAYIRNSFALFPVEIQIEKLLKYVRENYNYCVFCIRRYESKEELEKECPGVNENDHEEVDSD